MNDDRNQNCERFEAMIAAWFDAAGLSERVREELTTHVASCTACRESFELAERMEAALVSRRDQVPALDGLLPEFARAHAHVDTPQHAHPRLLSVFRAFMSPAGISITLVLWTAMLGLRFRQQIAEVFAWTSTDRFSALTNDISNLLLGVSGGNPYLLAGIYVALAVVVLGSTGVITLRYIRHS
jgi:hypothetical protein